MTMSVGSITVNGTAIPIQVGDTSAAVFDAYKGFVTTLQQKLFFTSGGLVPLTDASRADVEAAIKGLRDLMINGNLETIQISNTETVQVKKYITQEMGEQLDLLFQSLKAVGVTVSNVAGSAVSFPSTAIAQFWQNLVTASAILQGMFNIQKEINTRSLQAMIELDYVRTGNELINEKMSSLQDSLVGTQKVIDNLTSLQSLKNQVIMPNPGSFTAVTLFNWSARNAAGFQDAQYYASSYQRTASAYYAKPIAPILAPPANSNYILNTPLARELWSFQEEEQIRNPDWSTFAYVGLDRDPEGHPWAGQFYLWVPAALVDQNVPSQEFLNKYDLTILQPGDVNHDFDGNPPLAPDTWHGAKVYISHRADIVHAFNESRSMILDGYHREQPGSNTIIAPPSDPKSFEMITWMSAVPTGLEANVKQLVAYRDNIANLVANLSAANGNNPVDPSSLLGKLKQVLADIVNNFKTTGGGQVSYTTSLLSAYSGYAQWVLDKYNLRTTAANANQAGQIQQNLNFAITSAESTNDQQAEEVRRFMYVFEQFYQSASAILQAITKIIERMAQNIAR